jgi:glycosyltransferase involved in cell wall biosynthesis
MQRLRHLDSLERLEASFAEFRKVLMVTLSEPRVISVGQMTAPCLCIDADLSTEVAGIPPQDDGVGAACAWVLVSVYGEAIGSLVLEVPPKGLSGKQIAAAAAREFSGSFGVRLATPGPGESALPPFLATRQEVLQKAPKMTVVVCTHERPEGLDTCLQSLLIQEYPDFSILVVDNAPATDRSKSVVDALASPLLQYVVEPTKGLSWARNKALELIDGGIIAWIDDDETADSYWLAELARGFHNYPEADAVSGVMVPGELETSAQVWFEQFGGMNKHRGFTPDVFSPRTARLQSALYPLPSFGTGGNMAFRASAMERLGGFDVALGAGSRCMGAEDTLAFTELLRTSGTVIYQPTAVTRHFHRRTAEELQRQMRGYGVGLSAFYTSLVWHHPGCIPELVRLLPVAYRDLFSSNSLQSGDLPADFPPEFLRVKRRGMVVGPLSYLRAQLDASRLQRRREHDSITIPAPVE